MSVLPPPTGAPRPGTPPARAAATAPHRRRRGGVVVAVAASVVVTALVLTGMIWGGTSLIGAASKGNAHTAVKALDCAGACISLDDAYRMVETVGSGDVAALGLDPRPSSGPSELSSPEDDWSAARDAWQQDEVVGDDCMFAYLVTPVAGDARLRPRSDASTTVELQKFESQDAELDTGLRIFDDSADAAQHMSDMHRLIGACHRYRTTNAGGWDARVTSPVVWDALPGDVSAIAWVEDAGSEGRFYGVDLQRGNLVVRTTLVAGTIGLPAIRHYITTEAARMEAVTVHPHAPKTQRRPDA